MLNSSPASTRSSRRRTLQLRRGSAPPKESASFPGLGLTASLGSTEMPDHRASSRIARSVDGEEIETERVVIRTALD